jgi:hypothetical protein
MRQWKIALSLAIVGALAAPFVFRTYNVRTVSKVWVVPLTEKDKEQRKNYLGTKDCAYFEVSSERLSCLGTERETFKRIIEEELERGKRAEFHADLAKDLVLNVLIAVATGYCLFLLTFLIPMLFRGVASLVRRYWNWLKA